MYGISTRDPTYKTSINKLQILQNRAMRIIEVRLWNAPVADVYQKYGILAVNNLYRFEVAKFMYLCHCNQLP